MLHVFCFSYFSLSLFLLLPQARALGLTNTDSFLMGFHGNYSFVECRAKDGLPIWSEEKEQHFVEISNVNFEPNTLNLYREKYGGTTLGLGASVEKINQGRYREWDPSGKKLIKEIHSYTTKSGISGYEYWNVQDINIGWLRIDIERKSKDSIQLRQRLHWSDEKFTRDETCLLKKIPAPQLTSN